MAAKIHYPVAIVGGGPTGLTLANLLGVYGIQTLLIERNTATVHEPRAVSIDDESLRTMQAAGLVDEVMSQTVAGYGSRLLLGEEAAASPKYSQRKSRSAFRAAALSASRYWSGSCGRRWSASTMSPKPTAMS